MKTRSIKTILFLLIIIFFLLLIYFIIPDAPIKQTLFPLTAVLGLLFCILGIVLTKKYKIKGKLRISLILTGASAAFVLI